MKLKRLQHLAASQLDNVEAERRLHDGRHLARVLQCESGILKLLDKLATLCKGQQTALAGRARILTQSFSQLAEVGSLLQGVVDGVYAHLGCGQLLGCALLLYAQQDVGCLDKTVGANALHRLVVDAVGFGLHVIVGHHGGQQLLVAVLCKLGLERTQRVVLGIEGSTHLQLIVNKQVNVFLDRLLVDDSLGIVLVVGVFKL